MLTKQGVDISFAQGLDTKTDPKRVQMGKFLQLRNSIFTKGGLLQKRNGYGQLTALPDLTYSYLTTLNGNLTAIGENVAAYNSANASWVQKGIIKPLSVNTLPVLRNNLNQTACDTVVASNGLMCTVYLESDGSSTTAKYVIADSVTGQNISAPAVIPVASGAVTGGMRVFCLGTSFILVFTNVISAVSHLQYVAISINDTSIISANTDIAAAYVSASTLSWDGIVANNKLYIAYNTTTGGQAVKVTYLTPTFILATAHSFTGYKATMMSLAAVFIDFTSQLRLFINFYRLDSTIGFSAVLDGNLNLLMNPVQIITGPTVLNLTSTCIAEQNVCYIYYEVSNAYSYDSGIASNYIAGVQVIPILDTETSVFSSGAGSITVAPGTNNYFSLFIVDQTTPANISPGTYVSNQVGTTLTLSANTAGNSASSPGDSLTFSFVTSLGVLIRSVGLASKAFAVGNNIYFLTAYQSAYQPTYFLVTGGSHVASPVIAAKLAYENGGGYLTLGLPSVTVTGSTAQVAYLFKDLIASVNKNTAVPSGTQTAGIYSQTGINLSTFAIGTQDLDTVEIGNDLHLAGGFLGMYDGYLPVEHNFFLWPDMDTTTPTDAATWADSGGSMVAKPDGSTNANAYYYQVTYEWTDNQGNAFRSAPSIPIAVTTTGSGTAGQVTLNIPTLRLTMKTANPVKIVIYRWSVGQQAYYQVTSISTPLLNDTTADSVQYIDKLADATILGNNLLYTSGGVVEDVNAPSSNVLALFDTRLWLVDAEDKNLLWFSKQVIEATPVEMSDLFTMFVPPSTSTQGPTGPITALAAMDDKLIIFKNNAIYYINGTGPDNTGANNQYSQPIYITSTVGCMLQKSIVLMPNGLMFQSDKGIWLLDRGLNTTYIGAPVEDLTIGALVNSAVNIPETNQVRFTLNTGITLMYDYYYDQWGSFVGASAISSCIYQGLHSFINEFGKTYQETPGLYLDGSSPVLMSFKTGPLRLGDLQNYQRAYFFYLLGTYISPHKLYISLSYDYETQPSQTVLISPTNYSTPYGSGASQSPYGQGSPYGGPSNLESWRVFLARQRCMAFAISLEEIFDSTYGTTAGAGLTLSGLNIVMGFKKAFRPQDNQFSAG